MSKKKDYVYMVDERVDENGDFHFNDGFFLSWDDIWNEAVRRSHWRQRGPGKTGPVGKILNVIKDRHNLWKIEYPDGSGGRKVTISDLEVSKWVEYHKLRRSLGLEENDSMNKKRSDNSPNVSPDECVRCRSLLECCNGETEWAKRLFKQRAALYERIGFCEDYVPDIEYINRIKGDKFDCQD